MTTEKIYLSVSALNKYLEKKYVNDPYLKEVYLKGEVSNFKFHSNGTVYFSLKDENTKINALKFQGKQYADLQNGDSILVKGQISFYFPFGEHRIIVSDIKRDKIGELYKKYLELKTKLTDEGLFDSKYKKSIPKINNKIAIITAKTGAAIQDILRTIKRRYPLAKINIYSSLVQGENSINDIIKNIKLADNDSNDVIILARGGGSIEDLWSFNSEEVVRAIFSCKTPIITGIGHETDTTLADFVADLRASTPTAAAEIVTAITVDDIKKYLDQSKDRLYKLIKNTININKTKVDNYANNYYLKNFNTKYIDLKKKVDQYQEKLNLLIKNKINIQKINLEKNKDVFSNIDILTVKKRKLELAMEKLGSNSPLNILSKGYAIALNDKGNRVKSITELSKDDTVDILINDGRIITKVTEIREEVL